MPQTLETWPAVVPAAGRLPISSLAMAKERDAGTDSCHIHSSSGRPDFRSRGSGFNYRPADRLSSLTLIVLFLSLFKHCPASGDPFTHTAATQHALSSLPTPHLRTETDPVSETLCLFPADGRSAESQWFWDTGNKMHLFSVVHIFRNIRRAGNLLQ
jgi:hypothetical protein